MADPFRRMLEKIAARQAHMGITSASGIPSSAPEPTYACPICHDIGFFAADVPVGDPLFGKAIPCSCQAEKRRLQREERVRSMSALSVFASKTFETFQPTRLGLTDEQNRILTTAAEQAYQFAENPTGWLLLTGSFGTGKTHLAAAIANFRLRAHGEKALLVTVPDLLDHLRSAFGPSSEVAYDEVFDEVRNAPLLVLDDLGAEASTPWAQEKLYVLFNHRHARRLPTVVTTNQDLDSLDGRIRSRLLDQSLTRIVPLNVPDHRASASAGEQNLYDMSRYYLMTFDRFDDRRGELSEEAQRQMDALIQNARAYAQRPLGWFVLIGAPSTGKTHLAAAIAHERRAMGEQVIMTTCSELIDYLRAAFGGANSARFTRRMAELRTVPLLVLDNLIIDETTPAWVRERLHEILISRFDVGLPTVLTMYMTTDSLDERIGTRIKNKARCMVPSMKIPAYKGNVSPRRAAQAKY